MKDRIFFRDKSNALKGPFTERQVQEWYRKGWFESSFPFYFSRTDELPAESENSGITLDSLLSLNGIGCPFINVEEKREFEKNRIDLEKKLERIEKDIADLRQKCADIPNMEMRIVRMEKQLEELTTNEEQPKPTEPPAPKEEEAVKKKEQSVEETLSSLPNYSLLSRPPPPKWLFDFGWGGRQPAPKEEEAVKKKEQSVEEIGNAVASFVLDAFQVYASGDFGSWDKDRVEKIESVLREVTSEEDKKICERILVKRMKEKDFFCCDLCNAALFNYKHALIHFTSNHHYNKKETVPMKESGIARVRDVLAAITSLPEKWFEEDDNIEYERRAAHGGSHIGARGQFVPTYTFHLDCVLKYGQAIGRDPSTGRNTNMLSCVSKQIFDNFVPWYVDGGPLLLTLTVFLENLKGDVGRQLLADLREDIGWEETYCVYCELATGDCEGFYAHCLSYFHAQKFSQLGVRPDIFTMALNVRRKDLI